MQISPPVTWFGSKSRLVKDIIRHFPTHKTFVDVFGGSGAVLLGMRQTPGRVEVYNDLNKKLHTLFSVLRDPELSRRLKESLELTPYSRQEFNSAKTTIETENDPVELARKMIVIQRQSHGGLGNNWSFCVDSDAAGYSASVRKFHTGIENLDRIAKRVRRIQVENMDWREVLKTYDKPNTLFYLDPPYVPHTRIKGSYELEMTVEDHQQMIDTLLQIEGKAVLSGYATPIYEPLVAAGWTVETIETIAQTSKHRTKRVECLWVSPEVEIAVEETKGRSAAAYRTHALRTEQSEEAIKKAIRTFKRMKRRPTKKAIAEEVGLSREQVSRRYGHLFN